MNIITLAAHARTINNNPDIYTDSHSEMMNRTNDAVTTAAQAGITAWEIFLWASVFLCIVTIIAVETLGPIIMNRTAEDRRGLHVTALFVGFAACFLAYGALQAGGYL